MRFSLIKKKGAEGADPETLQELTNVKSFDKGMSWGVMEVVEKRG